MERGTVRTSSAQDTEGATRGAGAAPVIARSFDISSCTMRSKSSDMVAGCGTAAVRTRHQGTYSLGQPSFRVAPLSRAGLRVGKRSRTGSVTCDCTASAGFTVLPPYGSLMSFNKLPRAPRRLPLPSILERFSNFQRVVHHR